MSDAGPTRLGFQCKSTRPMFRQSRPNPVVEPGQAAAVRAGGVAGLWPGEPSMVNAPKRLALRVLVELALGVAPALTETGAARIQAPATRAGRAPNVRPAPEVLPSAGNLEPA